MFFELRFDPVERGQGERLVIGLRGLKHHPAPLKGGQEPHYLKKRTKGVTAKNALCLWRHHSTVALVAN